jgi:amylosucrase
MTHVLARHFPPRLTNATYATYIRCHDDIGWAVTDEDAAAVGLGGPAHRAFLSEFYEGGFPGSFAEGALFQVNPETGDKRISGSFASLAGLERALATGDREGAEAAVHRILMGHALIASYGGIPLIYMGDELALLNDCSYVSVPEHAHDSRWIHRPRMDWAMAARRLPDEGPMGQVFRGTRRILARRKALAALHGGVPIDVLQAPLQGIFAFRRAAPTGAMICLFNFTDRWLHLPEGWLRAEGTRQMWDELSERPVTVYDGAIALPPQARVWLV